MSQIENLSRDRPSRDIALDFFVGKKGSKTKGVSKA